MHKVDLASRIDKLERNGAKNYLGSKVLEHGSKINRSSGSNPLRVPPFFQVPADPSNGELQTSFDGPRDRLLLRTASPPSSSSFLQLSTGVHDAKIKF